MELTPEEHAWGLANDPAYANKVNAQQLSKDYAGVGAFLKKQEAQRQQDFQNTPSDVASPLRAPEREYQAPSSLEQWVARNDAMMASGNPRLQEEALSNRKTIQTELIKPPEAPETWAVTDANTYRDDYTKDTSDERSRISSFQTMLGAATPRGKNPDGTPKFSPAGDKALVYQFAKLLDPSGIVTDKDFKNAQASGNLDDAVQGFMSQMVKGVLPDKIRQDLLNVSSTYYNEALKGLEEKKAFYKQAAGAKGIPASQLYNEIGKQYEPYERRDPLDEAAVEVPGLGGTLLVAGKKLLGMDNEPEARTPTWAEQQPGYVDPTTIKPPTKTAADIYSENLNKTKGARSGTTRRAVTAREAAILGVPAGTMVDVGADEDG